YLDSNRYPLVHHILLTYCAILPSSLIFSFFFLMLPPPPRSTLFPYTTLFRSLQLKVERAASIDDFRELRQAYVEAVLKSKGEERSEEHTSELQSPCNLVCRLLLEKKKKKKK